MKKMNLTKLMAVLVVLCLITSTFVGSTLAKYTTGVTGSDTARVAHFGVELTAQADIFKTEYTGLNGISVLSKNAAGDVIAPGTTGTAMLFTIEGEPEVDVDVAISLGAYTIATLPAGDYKNYTDLNDATLYNLAEDYKPVKWTLKKDTVDVPGCVGVNLNVIEAKFAEMSTRYEVESDDFADIVGEYELTWEWAFNVDDIADTYMGQIAAGVVTPAPAGYVENESFAFDISVTQVD